MRNPNPTCPPPPRPHDPPKRRKIDRPEFFDDPHPAPAPATAEAAAAVASGDPVLSPPRKNPGFFRKPDKEAGVVAAGVVVVAPPLPSSGDGKGKQRLESGRNADIPPKKEATEDEELNETRQRIGEPADARRKQTPKPGSSSFSSKGAEKPERALVDFRLKDGDHSRSGSNQKPVKREPVEYDARYKGEVSDAPGIGNRGKRDEARPSSAKGRTGHEKGVDRQTGWHRDDLGEEGLPRRMKSKGEIVKDTEQETRAESKGSHSQQQRAKRESRWDESMASKHPWHGRGEDRSAQNMFERETETLDDRNRDGKDLLRTTREDSDVWDRLNDRRRDSREEDDKGGKQKLVRERLEDEWEGTESRGRSSLKTQGDDEDLGDKGRLKDVSGFTWDEQEDRRRSGGGRFGRGVKSSWSPEGRRNRGDNDDHDREWPEDRKEIERERGYRRDHGKDQDNSIDAQRERGRERETFREREFVREKDSDLARDRSRTRDREDTERWKNRQRDRPKDDKGVDGDYFHERGSWEFSNRERDKSERDWSHRNADERDRKEKGRASPQSSVVGDAMEHGGGKFYGMDPNRERGFAAGTFMGARRGQSSGFAGDSAIGNSDGDWSGGPEERVLSGDGFMPNDGREIYTFEEEGPPGLDQRFGDGGMSFGGLHNGRAGRGLKGAPGQRGRGGQFNDGRPAAFVAPHQGAGMMMRGMQQGGKGGRGRGGGGGGGGGAKGGRGGPRDVQRGGGIPMPYMGPGMPPHFGPMPNMGPNMGSGPIGPGGFPLPSFGGPVGWGGGGEMGMLPAGPPVSSVPGPRFGPAMGPGPNPYFNMPGPARVGMNPIPGSFLGEYSGPSPMVPEKSAVIRLTPRINAPPGRAPSRGEQNDYAQHFVDTGLRPQNFIRDVDLGDRFEEYPKLKELIARKDKLIQEQAFPPMYLQLDLHTTELTPEMFGTKFDVILVDPPWEEYVRRAPGVGDSMEWWAFEEIMNLRIEAIADTPSFIFLWVGDAEGLDHGRMCLKKWGFRRCEDICWVKTNRENPTSQLRHDSSTLLHHSKEHCLMGIKGTVRRSTDSHIIHANIDTDIIISEEPPYGSTLKPEEMYHIIEHFALGQRRLELFGEDHNIRAGWLTVGKSLTSSNFNVPAFAKYFADGDGKVWQGGRGNPPVDAPHLVGTTPEIEALRPKSPPPRTQQPQQSQAANSASGANSTTRKLLTDGQGTMPLLPTPTLASVQTPPNSSVIVISSSSPQGMQSQVGKPSQVSTFNTDTAEDDKGMMGNLQEAGYADGEVGKHMQNPKDVASL